jgi:hypothetical protein
MGFASTFAGLGFSGRSCSTHPTNCQRRCERSEAIQLSAGCGMDCFVASAPRNDVDGLVRKAISKSRSPIDRLRNPGWLATASAIDGYFAWGCFRYFGLEGTGSAFRLSRS